MPDVPDASDGGSLPAPETDPLPSPEPLPSQEPAPMIDIHPPHHAATTWRDFFIHIATIVLGLLIAIGLEQTVELVHRHREEREARANIREEIATNIDITQRDLKQLSLIRQKLAGDYDVLNGGVGDA